MTSAPEANPKNKTYRIKLRYPCFEHSDWLLRILEPIGKLKKSVAQINRNKY